MTNAFLVTTYYPDYLRISLASINRYIEEHADKRFIVVINNDNEKLKVTRKFAREVSGLSCDIFIRNTDKNKGHLGARLDALDFLRKIAPEDINYFMFVDDDDCVLNPSFDGKVPTLSHRAVVTHRLLEVLKFINDPTVDLDNQYIEYEEWKMGCVGVPYQFKVYYCFIETLKGFLPQLYQLYGSERVGEPDDVILMNLWNVYLQDRYGDLRPLFEEKSNNFSYALTYLEDRRGRYKVPEGVVDLRYGNRWDGKTTYASIIQPMIDTFRTYLFYNTLIKDYEQTRIG